MTNQRKRKRRRKRIPLYFKMASKRGIERCGKEQRDSMAIISVSLEACLVIKPEPDATSPNPMSNPEHHHNLLSRTTIHGSVRACRLASHKQTDFRSSIAQRFVVASLREDNNSRWSRTSGPLPVQEVQLNLHQRSPKDRESFRVSAN